MWKVILAVLGFISKILQVILNRREKLKPASEVLPENSPTAEAVKEAERKADEKFGKRTFYRTPSPTSETNPLQKPGSEGDMEPDILEDPDPKS